MDSPEPRKLDVPCTRQDTAALRNGDRILLSGRIVTGRDMVHRRLAAGAWEDRDGLLRDSFIYHCGPVVVPDGDGFRVVSAGPTTSMRDEPYQAAVIERYGLRGVIGKGGMGDATSGALVRASGVYLSARGGAGAALAASVVEVVDVHFLCEFGVPEAMWVLLVKDFPAIVTMDSTGRSVHRSVLEESRMAAARLSRRD